MKNFRSNKSILIILMLCLPTSLILSMMITTGQGGPTIPEFDPRNQWYWDVDIGDTIMIEIETIIIDEPTQQEMLRVREIATFNITWFIKNTTNHGIPFWEPNSNSQNVSMVVGNISKYNPVTDKIEVMYNNFTVAMFGVNFSHPIREKFATAGFPFPVLLPLNGSNPLQVDVLTPIINRSFLYPASPWGMNRFNDFNYDVGENNIYFSNSTENYFINATYYDNGTLRYVDAHYKLNQGGWKIYHQKVKRVFDWNITDEVQWGYDVGDSIYFGVNDINNKNEFKLDIAGFNESIAEVPSTLASGFTWNQTFQQVYANLSHWNGNTYVLDEINRTIGFANNFYINHFEQGAQGTQITPISADLDDYIFLMNNNTHQYTDKFPFDEVYYNEYSNHVFIEAYNTTDNIYSEILYDKRKGFNSYQRMEMDGNLIGVFYHKNMTMIRNQIEAENISLCSDIVGNNEVYMNFTFIPDENFEIYWATLPVNPLVEEFAYEIQNMPLYLDVYINNSIYIGAGPINVTLHYDDSQLSDDMEQFLAPYYFHPTNEEWEKVSEQQFILDTDANTMVVVGIELSPLLTNPQYFALGIEEWSWGVDVDDRIMGQAEAMVYEIDTGDYFTGFKDFLIFNITTIEDVTKEWSGEPHQTFSQVNFTWLYYNTSLGSLEWNPNDPYGDPSIMMEFCANDSSVFPLKFGDQNPNAMVPYILPLRYGKLNLTILAPVLNETFFGMNPNLPKWDQVIPNDIANTIYFYNSTYEYYLNLAYFENGTIKSVDAFYPIIDTYLYNSSFNRVFDYNLTSNVEWSVKAGDDLYFGDMNKEIKFHIVEINETCVDMYNINVLPYVNYHTFSNVWADVFYWNSTHEYWMYQYRSIIGAANNIYPFGPGMYHMYHEVELVWPFFLMPTGIDEQEMYDYLKILRGIMKMDTLSGIGDNYIYFTNSTGPNYIHFEWDNSTGVVKLLYGFMTNPLEDKDEYIAIFAKNRVILQSGLNSITLDNYYIPDITLSINITTNSLGCELYYAILDINPTNESLPVGTPIFYGDLMINNHTLVEGNFTMEVQLPLTIDLNDVNLHLSGWYPSMGGWLTMDAEDMDEILYIYSINTVLAIMSGEYPFCSIGAWSYTSKAPGAFILNSTAEDPDDDGDFTLNWGSSYLATSYSVYEHTSFINSTNISSATLIATGLTGYSLDREDYIDGTYFFIVEAINAEGSTLSNCIQVDVELPGPPGAFTLTSNAGTPDDNGAFTLSWGAAAGAVTYSIYEYSRYITEINSSLTTLATGVTSLSRSLSGYTDGTYHFIVVAHNAQGDTLSNCHTVVVAIPPEEPEDGDGGGIPGYPLYLLLAFFIVINAIVIQKKRKKLF